MRIIFNYQDLWEHVDKGYEEEEIPVKVNKDV